MYLVWTSRSELNHFLTAALLDWRIPADPQVCVLSERLCSRLDSALEPVGLRFVKVHPTPHRMQMGCGAEAAALIKTTNWFVPQAHCKQLWGNTCILGAAPA